MANPHSLKLTHENAADDALLAWCDEMKTVRNLARNTAVNYAHDMRVFFAFLQAYRGQRPSIKDLDALDMTAARSWLAAIAEKGVNAASRARAVSAVRTFYKWLGKKNLSKNTVMLTLRPPKKLARIPHPLSPLQAQDFLIETESARDDWIGLRDRALFSLLYGAGLRIGEALVLTKKDWCMASTNQMTIRGKGNKQRVVPIIAAIQAAVTKYINACPFAWTDADPLFRGAKGAGLHATVAQKAMRDLRLQLQLPDTATPHALRHSFASHLLNNGADLRSIQELLGHASLSTTQHYTSIDESKMLNVYAKAHPRSKG